MHSVSALDIKELITLNTDCSERNAVERASGEAPRIYSGIFVGDHVRSNFLEGSCAFYTIRTSSIEVSK